MNRYVAEELLGTDNLTKIAYQNEREEAIASVAYFQAIEETKRNYEGSTAYKMGMAILENLPECNHD